MRSADEKTTGLTAQMGDTVVTHASWRSRAVAAEYDDKRRLFGISLARSTMHEVRQSAGGGTKPIAVAEADQDLLLDMQRTCRAAQGASLAASIKRRASGPSAEPTSEKN
jgi:hypothetical protein